LCTRSIDLSGNWLRCLASTASSAGNMTKQTTVPAVCSTKPATDAQVNSCCLTQTQESSQILLAAEGSLQACSSVSIRTALADSQTCTATNQHAKMDGGLKHALPDLLLQLCSSVQNMSAKQQEVHLYAWPNASSTRPFLYLCSQRSMQPSCLAFAPPGLISCCHHLCRHVPGLSEQQIIPNRFHVICEN